MTGFGVRISPPPRKNTVWNPSAGGLAEASSGRSLNSKSTVTRQPVWTKWPMCVPTYFVPVSCGANDEFRLTNHDVATPRAGKYYSINESNYTRWSVGYQKVVRCFKGVDGDGHGKNARYIGSLVADFHRNLLAGGVFMYPADTKSPNGKLRLLYEASPLAFVAEQAGGAASDGTTPILDIEPKELHQRTPLVIGSRDDVAFVQRTLREVEAAV